ncbi:hypothetical protein G3T14_15140 [Methylobacterium sp. BTF04]|uniref:hypothetical protein n=1 Tax=Methylobacterium sp. BTF04 TaxID=2708300 RepID=UPI0013D1E2EA|nr:hypothetical protein [Methylobacterium sp. BTF04]NEU13456.1 hypothetical protein [Methylobacterium sp. BTF04]
MTLPRSRTIRAVPVLLALLVSSRAPAAEGECAETMDLATPVTLGRVVGAQRVPFLKSAEQAKGCPSRDAACRDAAYLVEGNTVVVAGTLRDFACVTYVGAKGATRTGWIASDALADVPAEPPTLEAWVGTWSAGPEQDITILRKGDTLQVSGEATYGARDPARVARGAVNSGSFSATVRPNGASLGFTDDADATKPYAAGDDTTCRVRMQVLPPLLVAESNAACGGMNVTFTGFYRRKG